MNVEDSLMETLSEAIYQLDNGGFDPDRPFDGQPHTDQGERGKTLCNLRFRDIADCVAIGFLRSCGFSEERIRASTRNDLYEAVDEDPDFDPCAAIQIANCEMERRMGIYPNLPNQRHGKR